MKRGTRTFIKIEFNSFFQWLNINLPYIYSHLCVYVFEFETLKDTSFILQHLKKVDFLILFSALIAISLKQKKVENYQMEMPKAVIFFQNKNDILFKMTHLLSL